MIVAVALHFRLQCLTGQLEAPQHQQGSLQGSIPWKRRLRRHSELLNACSFQPEVLVSEHQQREPFFTTSRRGGITFLHCPQTQLMHLRDNGLLSVRSSAASL
jgi:hypothetical protein